MKIRNSAWLCSLSAILCVATSAFGHCQIPCGIYGDDLRFSLMREHVTTIEKSMTEIARLEKTQGENANQLARWVSNKEQHADELAQIVTYYFMAQRVKPLPEGAEKAQSEAYAQKIALLHELLFYSMKAKQTTDAQYCEQLRSTIDAFEKLYTAK